GEDARRWMHGPQSREIVEMRQALTERLPKALEIVDELLKTEDPIMQLQIVKEVLDRTLGKPKLSDSETADSVRAELASLFGRLRAKMTGDEYRTLLRNISEEGF